MSAPAAWRWCLAAGLVAFACSWGFGRIPGLIACGDAGGWGPIFAFELARTPADIQALFGAEPCRSGLVAAQRTGLWLDALGFIPAYAAFLCLAAWATAGRRAWPVIAGLLVAGAADQLEGALLFSVLRALPGDQPTLDALFWAVRVKFLLLALGTLAIGILLALRWRAVPFGFGLVIAFGAGWALRGFFALPAPGMMDGFTVAWAALLALAALSALRRRSGWGRSPETSAP